MTHTRWKDDPTRGELLGLYAQVDALLAGHSCDVSTDCCHFGRTGREPYPTAVEVAELEYGMAASGGSSSFASAKKKTLPVLVEERRCPLLSADGRCRVYASRPFGCRTFFCDRARARTRTQGEAGPLPRDKIQAVGRLVADLSARAFVRDPGPRTLEAALDRIVRGETVRVDRK